MEREKSVKTKDVITSLCRLLSGLIGGSIPTADAFRRAKFNRKDAVIDMWSVLHSLLQRAFALDCGCQDFREKDTDKQFRFVRSALWFCGYGAGWVVGPRTKRHIEDVGSRDLLLAFGWVLSTANLLDVLLREKVLQLDNLSCVPQTSGLMPVLADIWSQDENLAVMKDQDLQALQWQYGKLRLQWKSLFSSHEEKSRLTHRILSVVGQRNDCQSCHGNTTSTALDKELERIQRLNGILGAYLEWKLHEPLFWCWMDSVMDGSVPDVCEDNTADRSPAVQDVSQRCPHTDKTSRAIRRLDKMMLKLQTELRTRRTLTLSSQARHQGLSSQLSDGQKLEVEKKVAGNLEGLRLQNTATSTSIGFVPCLQEWMEPSRRAHLKGPSLTGTAGTLQASQALGELRNRQVVLQKQLENLRQNMREEMEKLTSRMKGVVLIPPHQR